MRAWRVLVFLFSVFPVSTWGQHWAQTADETIWRGKYTNCDKGYAIELPQGVIAHGSLPPSPNHGILVSGQAPDTTKEVTLDNQRLIGVYDTYDAADYGSARAYLKQLLEREGSLQILKYSNNKFHGYPAAYVHFRKTKGNASLDTEEMVAYRRSKTDSPIFYVIWVRSTSQSFEQDKKLYEQVRSGFRLLPMPKGQCSND